MLNGLYKILPFKSPWICTYFNNNDILYYRIYQLTWKDNNEFWSLINIATHMCLWSEVNPNVNWLSRLIFESTFIWRADKVEYMMHLWCYMLYVICIPKMNSACNSLGKLWYWHLIKYTNLSSYQRKEQIEFQNILFTMWFT